MLLSVSFMPAAVFVGYGAFKSLKGVGESATILLYFTGLISSGKGG